MKYKSQKDISKIPSSYIVMDIGNAKGIHHDNLVNIKMLPKDDCNKDEYIHSLITTYKEGIAIITNYLVKNKHNKSIVIVVNEDLLGKRAIDINPTKLICKFIEDRYGYKSFKFTNTVVRKMLEQSKFNADGLIKLIKDMDKVRKILK